ncbi:MAG: methyltransferase domain-containing protein [Cyanobacteria bacterium REEB65]|nr:methyltransferase domain-containing protein [Cyanobacteria bacterium REEB65]
MLEHAISQWPHGDRQRAESFGEAADSYDRLRPPYPPALFDELAAWSPRQVLDVGCGTGKVAGALAARALSVLGIDPDERMASMARARGIPVEVATFENWDDQGRQFDLIACGNAWHWIDPASGSAKVATLLRSGGAFAMFWVVDVLEDAVLEALQPVYRKHAADTRIYGTPPPPRAADNPLVGFDALGAVEGRVYPAHRVLGAAQWAELLTTVSDHRRLAPDRLATLVQAVQDTLDSLGGSVRSVCETRLWLVRRG